MSIRSSALIRASLAPLMLAMASPVLAQDNEYARPTELPAPPVVAPAAPLPSAPGLPPLTTAPAAPANTSYVPAVGYQGDPRAREAWLAECRRRTDDYYGGRRNNGGVIGALFSLPFGNNLSSQLGPLLQYLPPDSQQTLGTLLESGGTRTGGGLLGVICGAPIGALFALFFYFIGMGIQNWLATLFGGTGSFGKFFIANAAYYTPIVLITSIIGNIPFVNCLGFLLSLYIIYLNFIALQAVHKLTSGKAVIVILIPMFVGCLFTICFLVFALALLGPAVSDVFNSINSTLTP